jgi:ribose/xylose/arabinose/galactoside ABC-type transport system permease subunit
LVWFGPLTRTRLSELTGFTRGQANRGAGRSSRQGLDYSWGRTFTRFDRYLYAIGGDELLAQQAGVKVDRIKIITCAIAGMFCRLAALFLATRLGSAHRRTGGNILFPAVTAVGGVAL